MDNVRLQKVLRHIDPRAHVGLEIGALDNPMLTGPCVRYVDYTTTAQLKQNHANNPAVRAEHIVDVSYVWGDKTLAEAVEHQRFDFVVASHVIEHVPDLITWLFELAQVLKPDGVVSLVVPDKRYTFDALRPDTTISELVAAHLERRRRPSVQQIFGYLSQHVQIDVPGAWRGADTIKQVHDETYAWQVVQRVVRTGEYFDAHCWVFTPDSFLDLLGTLAKLGLLPFDVLEFTPTTLDQIDFFVTLRRSPEGAVTRPLLASPLERRAAAPAPRVPRPADDLDVVRRAADILLLAETERTAARALATEMLRGQQAFNLEVVSILEELSPGPRGAELELLVRRRLEALANEPQGVGGPGVVGSVKRAIVPPAAMAARRQLEFFAASRTAITGLLLGWAQGELAQVPTPSVTGSWLAPWMNRQLTFQNAVRRHVEASR